jgi:hypothetical protein
VKPESASSGASFTALTETPAASVATLKAAVPPVTEAASLAPALPKDWSHAR